MSRKFSELLAKMSPESRERSKQRTEEMLAEIVSDLDAADLPDIRRLETRERLARMVMRLLEHWQLSPGEQCLLLGLSSTSLDEYRKGQPLAENMDLLKRVGHLLAIHKALRIFFPCDRDMAYRWVRQPNQHFAGLRPLDLMIRDDEGLISVRRHLEFEQGLQGL